MLESFIKKRLFADFLHAGDVIVTSADYTRYSLSLDLVFVEFECRYSECSSWLYDNRALVVHMNDSGADRSFRNNDNIINDQDKVVLGDATPDFFGNMFTRFEYKSFALDLTFAYSFGNDAYNAVRRITESGLDFSNQSTSLMRRWSMEGQRTDIPRISYGDRIGNNDFSDRWIEDGSYLRLKTVNLSYRVPVPGTWTWLQGLTIWAEAQNLVTLTKYLGSDPEFSIGNGVYYQGIDCGNLAQGRSFSLGVKINL